MFDCGAAILVDYTPDGALCEDCDEARATWARVTEARMATARLPVPDLSAWETPILVDVALVPVPNQPISPVVDVQARAHSNRGEPPTDRASRRADAEAHGDGDPRGGPDHREGGGLMAEHTPGPWRVSTLDARTVGPSRLLVCGGLQVQQLQAVAIVTLRTGETDANARLIAAAPDLLAALRLCRSAINEEVIAAGDLDHPTIRAHAKAAEQADAAIAKAEGR